MPVTKQKSFLDSNVVLYLLSGDASKADRAEALLKTSPLISVQVLNEVTHVCVRKLKMSWDEIRQFLELVRSFCKVVPLTEKIHDRARWIAEHHQLSFYDSCIVAAAAGSSCLTLYSEDMNHGQTFEENVTIQNPFIDQ
ncbi:putative nucleic acid-binding protein [Kerstersia gyiorum]|uniref:Putative nucleic acid-binding protein n=1 Tax=Kerstersia gyiorum TaxID=206506 RepID=A0A4Q7MP88_9BURK|nr:PIN domain-containing protein [Kerstersia gyiorum]KAB0544401.1 PIN domain-containing protein [Kerstersia gyiorum]RZS69523.1 putative nucleic acid-binding protein [Kerstersia gyiorum]